MNRPSWLAGGLLAGLFVALHVPFLPQSLEDLDSINFALGLRDFDVTRHQPHPPGYPLFILAGKAVHALGISEVRSLSLVSVIGGALAAFACLMLFRCLDEDRSDNTSTWIAVGLVVTCPLFWITSARPLSDAAGLGAVLAVQAMLVRSSRPVTLATCMALAGLAAGIRSQVVWLTLPLFPLCVWRLPSKERVSALVTGLGAYGVGALLWAVPLVIVTGGPTVYWRAFFNQGAEDLTGVAMLATSHSLRLLVSTLQLAFVSPWGYWQSAAAVLLFAALGVVHLARRSRPTLMTLVCAFGPYLIFDLLFQEAITTRYALPLVIPVAYLAVTGLSLVGTMPVVGIAGAIVFASILVDDHVALGYAKWSAPAFRMLGDMQAAKDNGLIHAPVLAMHRKDDFDMRRPIQWVDGALPTFASRLPAPPKHEWLELVKYWNGGGRAPIWFVADPLRSDLALIRYQGRPTIYRWPFSETELVGGARPNEMDWHRIDVPDWYLGEGWALTPETAGIANEDRRGPGYGAIRGWIRRPESPMTLMVGGRNLSSDGKPASLKIAIDGVPIDQPPVPPGFFLRLLTVPVASGGSGDFAEITIESDSVALAVEQFDAQPAGRMVYGFGEGWNEREYTPSTGALWRWSSDRSTLRVRAEGHALALSLRGEIEAASTSHVRVLVGQTVVSEFDVSRSFTRTVFVPASALQSQESQITIESSAWYVPAENQSRSQDRRRLGLKLYDCTLSQVS